MSRRLLSVLPLAALLACADEATTYDNDGFSSVIAPNSESAPEEEVVPTSDFAVARVSLLQSLEVPLFPKKDASPLPVIANKNAVVRISVRPGANAAHEKSIVPIVRLVDTGTTIAGTPMDVPTSGDMIFDVRVPGAQIAPSTTLRIDVLPASSSSSDASLSTWPVSGPARSLGAEVSGAMHLVLVPVNTVKSPRYSQVDVTPDLVADFRARLLAMYPLGQDRVRIDVHAPYDTQLTPSEAYPFQLLEEIANLHAADGADHETRYMALFDFDTDAFPIDTTKAIALYGGLAEPVSMDSVMNHTTSHPVAVASFSRARHGLSALSMPTNREDTATKIAGWEKCRVDVTRDYFESERAAALAYDVALHELGHLYSLEHVSTTIHPFGAGEADASFPRADGTIGRTGYDASSSRFVDPCFTDIMGYSNVQWISEYTYRKLHDLIRGS